jgi:nucleoside-diphosphate-sugar epimerase
LTPSAVEVATFSNVQAWREELRIFVTGGTGTIGAAMVEQLVRDGHEVMALARSTQAAARLRALGAFPVAGDIRRPEDWLHDLPRLDAIVHAATDFAHDMGEVDSRLLDRLLAAAAEMGRPRFLYTGGCWLFGATGDRIATESSPFNPPPAFAWMARNLKRVLESEEVEGMAVHPGLVVDESGGVLAGFIGEARRKRPLTVIGDPGVCWPLVHTRDLARLYALVLAHGKRGQAYIGASVEGAPVGALATAIARRLGISKPAFHVISADAAAAERGEWARGYALDQRLSSRKARRELGWAPRVADPIGALDLGTADRSSNPPDEADHPAVV